MKNTTERLELLKNQQKAIGATYKPVFYRLRDPHQLAEFEELLNVPGITLVDYILDQITEFVKLQHPEKRFSTEELKEATKKHIGKTDLDEYGVWVYYPWSRRIVHVLDEKEFIDVRTSRNQYKITKEERDILASKKIGIIGLSVGQSVSVTLAMERICGELRLADFDLLELTNLNRIRTGVHNLGLAKVYSVAREIAEIDPFLKVVCFPQGLSEENLDEFFTHGGNLDLLVEESDGFDIKILSRFKARELKIPVIMEASDRCMVDVERFDLEPDRKILHGIVKHLDVATLKSLKTNEEKIPYMLDILGLGTTTPRLRASMLEMQQTITTWPQLASAVTMGGGITADVSRRMLLNQFTDSGRYYVDIDHLIGNKDNTGEETAVRDQSTANKNPINPGQINSFVKTLNFGTPAEITEEIMIQIVEAGMAAPSYANQQPWKFTSVKGKLLLLFDSGSFVSFLDEKAYNATLSVGAALENCILKAQELGYTTNYTIHTGAIEQGFIIECDFKKNDQVAQPKEGSLSEYIFKRHTNRSAGAERDIPEPILEELFAVNLDKSRYSLTLITDKEKIIQLSKISGKTERMRMLNATTHADYFNHEIRLAANNEEPIREGLDVHLLGIPAAAQTAFEVISDPAVSRLLNEWDKGSLFEKLTEHSVSGSSAIGLIQIPQASSTEDLVNAGRYLEKIWLTATKNTLAFQPICLPLCFLKLLGNTNTDKISKKTFSELKALNTQFSLIFNRDDQQTPVFLFRLFYSDNSVGHSLRKTLNDVYFKS